VAKVIRHPAYDSVSDDSDVAVFKLVQPVTFNAAIKPICLPMTDVAAGSMCYITGWGDTAGTQQIARYLRVNCDAFFFIKISPFEHIS